jgi:hypothetical protein
MDVAVLARKWIFIAIYIQIFQTIFLKNWA